MLVLAIAPRCNDVDDVVQEACTAMWRKIEEFDQSRDFTTWALTFVRYQTLAWLKKSGRDRLTLSSDTIEQLCHTISAEARRDSRRVEALELCMSGLSENEQQLMAMRFVEGVTVTEIAARQSRESHQGVNTVESLYKRFSRLKASLLRCIESRLLEANE